MPMEYIMGIIREKTATKAEFKSNLIKHVNSFFDQLKSHI